MVGLCQKVEFVETMKKYAYEIHQLIEISNVFYQITYSTDRDKIMKKADHPLNVIMVRYPHKLLQIAQNIFSESLKSLKITHYDKIDFSSPFKQK